MKKLVFAIVMAMAVSAWAQEEKTMTNNELQLKAQAMQNEFLYLQERQKNLQAEYKRIQDELKSRQPEPKPKPPEDKK